MNTFQTLFGLLREAALGKADTQLIVVSPSIKTATPVAKAQ
jgi:hypothetical protein